MPDALPNDAPPDSPQAQPSDTSSAQRETAAPDPLTAEEQLALYEQHLKETDWGHQPC